eukprot:10296766-Alexandrium_andersonii.AAC.1
MRGKSFALRLQRLRGYSAPCPSDLSSGALQEVGGSTRGRRLDPEAEEPAAAALRLPGREAAVSYTHLTLPTICSV